MGREESMSGFPISSRTLISVIKRGVHDEVQAAPQEREKKHAGEKDARRLTTG